MPPVYLTGGISHLHPGFWLQESSQLLDDEDGGGAGNGHHNQAFVFECQNHAYDQTGSAADHVIGSREDRREGHGG